jgi:hypothetical protein
MSPEPRPVPGPFTLSPHHRQERQYSMFRILFIHEAEEPKAEPRTRTIHGKSKPPSRVAVQHVLNSVYEVCPESIQPYLISRKPVAWPWCKLGSQSEETFLRIREQSLSRAPLCNFNGHERNMHQWHLTAEITELIAHTSLVRLTGVSTCGRHTYTFHALSGHISSPALFEVSRKNRLLRFPFWTFWNLLRMLNLLLKCWA